MKTSDIARAIDYEQPNTDSTLQTLQSRGVVEQVPNVSPTHWRLVVVHRGSDPYLEVAALVGKGEWTTYGDISIVVRGDTDAARGVCRAAATLSDFPNPHRVLMQGGFIHPRWKTEDGQGREVCRKRLEDDDVDVSDDWKADPARMFSRWKGSDGRNTRDASCGGVPPGGGGLPASVRRAARPAPGGACPVRPSSPCSAGADPAPRGRPARGGRGP